MLQLVEKVEKIKEYINNIITVIQAYKPNTVCTSQKKLKYLADEMKEVILDNSQVEVNYMRDVVDTEFYIAFQIPVFLKTSVEFEVETSSRASITVTNSGTNIYDGGLKGTRRLAINVPNTKVNSEGWRPSNVIIRSNSNFTKFNLQNQEDVIAVQGNLAGIENLDCAFMFNRNLRVANLKNIESKQINYTFAECNSLISFQADSLQCVEAVSAFEDCKKLRYVSMDFSTIENCYKMFDGCTSLEKIDVPKGSKIPNKLDLTDTKIQTKELISLISNLKKLDEKQRIYISRDLLAKFSEVQLQSFESKGYILTIKTPIGDEGDYE